MKYAAFFRNVNLGHPRSPSREQFEAAFRDAGADAATAFQTNGTLVFVAANLTLARRAMRAACATLHALCGLAEPAFLRSLRELAKLAASDPFGAFATAPVADRYVSFLAPKAIASVHAPLESARRDVEVFRFTKGEALSVTFEVRGHAGSPTALLEKTLRAPVTTRTWNTVRRLVERHG